MANKIPASVFIVAQNEEKHIGEVLGALQDFAEIIVVDSGSTDATVAIAKSQGATVITQEWLGFARQKNFAMAQCRSEWLLNVDADEVLSTEVIEQIRTMVARNENQALKLYFEDIFWGEPMSVHSGKRSIVRLFKKGQAAYPLDRKVHENLVIQPGVDIVKARGLVKHYGYGTTELLMQKKNKYSGLKALEKHEKNKKPSLLKLLVIFPVTFIKSYFFQRMFLSGKRGLVHAHLEAIYAFLKEAKLFELSGRKE